MLKMHYGQPSYVFSSGGVEARVTLVGGMVTAAFPGSGREIEPYFIAPWWNEAQPSPPLLSALRGNFFCLPFGTSAPTPEGKEYITHGEPANELWEKLSLVDGELRMKLDLKLDEGSIEKVVKLREGHPVVYETNIVRGLVGDLPVAYHPNLQLTKRVNSCILDMTPPVYGRTYEWDTESSDQGGYALLKTATEIKDFSKVPTIYEGRTADMTRPPHAKGYEDIAISISDKSKEFCFGAITVPDENYLYFQLKNPRDFAATMFWCSNNGRYYEPWNGRVFGCLGFEECTSFYCLGLEHGKKNVLSDMGFDTYIAFDGGERAFPIISGAIEVPEGFAGVKDIVRGSDGTLDILGKGGEKFTINCDVDWLK